MSQRQLASSTDMDEGLMSRIVRHRIEQDLVLRRARRRTPYQPTGDAMLDAWSDVCDFTKHRIVRAHIAPQRRGDAPCCCQQPSAMSAFWAATGLSEA
ncbi:MAG: hypothetical protein R3C05_04800 [Pirellulaceae bacterium]